MKREIPAVFFVAAFAALNASADLAVELGSAATVDTEAVTNVAFAVGNSSIVNMRMLLNAQWNNNAEVIFGCGADNDGLLSADEELLLVGWDCGSWKAVDCRDQTRPSVLKGLGWKLVRLWSVDWALDRPRAEQELLSLLASLKS